MQWIVYADVLSSKASFAGFNSVKKSKSICSIPTYSDMCLLAFNQDSNPSLKLFNNCHSLTQHSYYQFCLLARRYIKPNFKSRKKTRLIFKLESSDFFQYIHLLILNLVPTPVSYFFRGISFGHQTSFYQKNNQIIKDLLKIAILHKRKITQNNGVLIP